MDFVWSDGHTMMMGMLVLLQPVGGHIELNNNINGWSCGWNMGWK